MRSTWRSASDGRRTSSAIATREANTRRWPQANRCKEAGVRPSMGSVGDAYDNAMCESFFATLECELLDRRRFASHAEAKMAVFSFIEGRSQSQAATLGARL